MSNLIEGLQHISTDIILTLKAVFFHPLSWGFFLGLLVSTLIHLYFLMTTPPEEEPLFISLLQFRKKIGKKRWYECFEIDSLLFRSLLLIVILMWFIFVAIVFYGPSTTG